MFHLEPRPVVNPPMKHFHDRIIDLVAAESRSESERSAFGHLHIVPGLKPGTAVFASLRIMTGDLTIDSMLRQFQVTPESTLERC